MIKKRESNRKRRICIVDAYSAANQYAELFRQSGFEVFHLQSQLTIPEVYAKSFRPDHFDRLFVRGAHADSSLLNELRHLELDHLIAGIESGVQTASELSHQLGIPGNHPRLSEARHDKYKMARAVGDRGLRIPKNHLVANKEEALDWYRNLQLARAVVKPPASAGTDSVSVISSEAELLSAFDTIFESTNRLGVQNKAVLLQEYIGGVEYAVNTVSLNGKHYLCQIWKYHKQETSSGRFIFDWEELIDPHDELFSYVEQVLDSLEIRFGPAHTEVKIDDRGPCLIESAARLDGLSHLQFEKVTVGKAHLQLTHDLCADTLHFDKKVPRTYKKLNQARHVELIVVRSCYAGSLTKFKIIESLPSFVSLSLKISSGQWLPATEDIFSSPGVVFLAHPDQDQLEKDYRRIRQLEAEGLYQES